MNDFLGDPITILLVSIIVVVGSIIVLRIGAFLSLILGALTVSVWSAFLQDDAFDPVACVTNVCEALGTTTGKIGLLIFLGAVVGKLTTDSGAADRIVYFCRRLFGEKRFPAALSVSAFILSIPVFYDATFYLLLPLAKSAYRSVRKNYVFYLLAVGLAATISHTTIPPTPGPITVANEFNVSIGLALKVGLLVGIVLLPFALFLAWIFNKVLPNPTIDAAVLEDMRVQNESSDATTPSSDPSTPSNDGNMPGLLLSFAPIVVPALLLAISSIIDSRLGKYDPNVSTSLWRGAFAVVGNANVALGLAALLAAIPLVVRSREEKKLSPLSEKLNSALTIAGTIILITSAGGAYGEMLRDSGIGERIKDLFVTSGHFSGASILSLAFLSTSLLKLAQGSSTTAMITSAGVFASMGLSSDELGFNTVYLVTAIGMGSCVASWMNDSGFCVFSRSSGIAETDCLKVWTLGTGLLGVTGFIITLIMSSCFPMI